MLNNFFTFWTHKMWFHLTKYLFNFLIIRYQKHRSVAKLVQKKIGTKIKAEQLAHTVAAIICTKPIILHLVTQRKHSERSYHLNRALSRLKVCATALARCHSLRKSLANLSLKQCIFDCLLSVLYVNNE